MRVLCWMVALLLLAGDTSAQNSLPAPGKHKAVRAADPQRAAWKETNQGDSATLDLSLHSPQGTAPNLIPYQPPDWSSALVVSVIPGTNQDAAEVGPQDTLYIDWAVLNNGTAPTPSTFFVSLFLDGVEIGSWFSDPPLNSNFFISVQDFQIAAPGPGSHTLRMDIDTTQAITELNENDNSLVREILVRSDEEHDPIFIFFPSIRQGDGLGTGVALANPTSEEAVIDLFLLDSVQNVLGSTRLVVPPNSQLARTVDQFFPRVEGDDNAWMTARSSNLGVAGFFLTFQGSAENIDGAEAAVRGSPVLVFPQIRCGENDFTEISLLGAGEIELELRASDGSVLGSIKIQLGVEGKLGRFNGRVGDLFQAEACTAGAYLLARNRQSNLVGFEAFGSTDFLGGRNAILATEQARFIPIRLFGAQLVQVPTLESTIFLINPTGAQADVTLSAFATGIAQGPPAATAEMQLAPGAVISGNALELLGLEDFVGWLQVDSTVAGVVGDVSFGDPEGTYLASVQLQRTPLRSVVASHVADGFGFFTGLTFLNTNSDPSLVRLEVFNVEAQKTGEVELTLQPLEHRPRLLPELIPGFQPQVGGFIKIAAEPGVFSFELFSLLNQGRLLSLAAVPPQLGSGTVTGQLMIPEVAAASSVKRYPRSRAKGILLDSDLEFALGEALIKFRPGVSPADFEALLSSIPEAEWLAGGADVWRLSLPRTDIRPAASPSEQGQDGLKESTLAWIEELNGQHNILYAEPNYLYQAFGNGFPNDEYFPLQWHYNPIHLPQAWGLTAGDPGLIIAAIDSGAKFGHPDLAPRLTGGQFDFIVDLDNSLDGDGMDASAEDPGDDPNRLSSSFHGTHVAGTLGAATGNTIGVAGVNQVSPLMTLRVLGPVGARNFDVAQAVLYAAGLPNGSERLPDQAARIINMSLGGFGRSQTLADAIAAAQAEGVLVVAAAGNENTDRQSYPAGFDGVVSVGATNLSNSRATYSNFGPRVDVMAPGGDVTQDLNGDGFADGVLSTLWNEANDRPNFQFYEGTSMAAPHVAGVASLILAINPDLSPSQVRGILQETAIDLGDPGRDDSFGFGLVDALAAVREAGATAPDEPLLLLSTDALDFGRSQTLSTVILSNGGGGELVLERVVSEMDQGSDWLSVLLDRATLLVTVSREGLAEGVYNGRIQVESNGGDATIEVRMEVVAPGSEDLGTLFILALDPFGLETLGAVQTTADQDYRFRLSPLLAGSYFIVAGSDRDEDGFICDEGEICGFFPVANQPSFVQVEANQTRSGIDFSVQLPEDVGPSAALESALPGGFRIQPRRLPPLKLGPTASSPHQR